MRLATAALLLLSFTMLAVPARAEDKPLVIVMNHEPETLDATRALNGVITLPVIENVTEKLVDLDKNGAPSPGLATWEVAPDGLSITFHLRHGVKFQSGDPFTADDVVFSHERMTRNPTYRSADPFLDHVEKIDDYTVRFVFRQPEATYFVRRALVIVSKAYHDRVGEDEFVKHPVGTGAYSFVSYQPGQSIDLAAFDGYWGGAPSVRNVHFEFVNDDSTRVAKLRAGEADLILNVPYPQMDLLAKAGFKFARLETTPTPSVTFIVQNPDMPWHDIRVRQAVAFAIDADAIVKGIMLGVPKHYAGFAPGQIGYDPDLKPYPYDPAQSKKLLAAAGFANGFKMPLLYWIGEDYGMKETTEAVALYLRQVGIDAEVQGMEVPKMVALMQKNAKNPEQATTVTLGPTPFANYYEPTSALTFVWASFSPFSTYRNADFDKYAAAAMASFDPAKRAEAVKAATRIMHDDYVTIPIWNNVAVYAMKPNIDFAPTPHALIRMEVKDVTVR